MFYRKKKIKREITLDEIFLDSKNIPGFSQENFEGRLEKAIPRSVFVLIGVFFLAPAIFLFARIADLQILRGGSFESRSENNRLRADFIPGERGIIYDRNRKELAWNSSAFRVVISGNDLESFDPVAMKAVEKDFVFENDLVSKFNLARANKNDLVVYITDSWQTAEEFRKAFPRFSLKIEQFSLRKYASSGGFSQAIGYLGFEDSRDYADKFVGKDGIEKSYESALKGEGGTKLVEIDSKNQIISESVQEDPVSGKNIMLTIDSRLSAALYDILKQVSEGNGFNGGSGVVMDALTGEVLALTNYPEYNSSVLSGGGSPEEIQSLINNPKKPFFNRAIKGLYSPGSSIKPLIAIAALNEKIIDQQKEILAYGSISIPNPYDSAKKSVFYDWKVHGPVDMRKAIAVSADVYFYTIGGGYGDVKGLGIQKIEEYASRFNFGKKTGVDLEGEESGMIPSPEFKKISNPKDPVWRIGDTYNISIGQGDWQVTPLQMAAFASVVANDGVTARPHLLKSLINSETNQTTYFESEKPKDDVFIPKEIFKIVKEGMRKTVIEGTAKALSDLGIPVAGKTGTAEIGSGEYVNSWFIGFLPYTAGPSGSGPYEKPRLAISIVLERGKATNLIGAVFATRQLLEWMAIHTPEYLK